MKIYQIAIPLILLDVLSPVGPTECSCSGSHHTEIPEPVICPEAVLTEQTSEMALLTRDGAEELYFRAWEDSVTMSVFNMDDQSGSKYAKPFTADQFRRLKGQVASCGIYHEVHQCNLPQENKTFTELFLYEGVQMTFDGYYCVFGDQKDYTMQGEITKLRNTFFSLFPEELGLSY